MVCFESEGAIPARLPALAMHLRKESPFTTRPLPLGPSRFFRVQLSAAATAEDHHCHLPLRAAAAQAASP